MGTFAETANVDCLSLSTKENKLPFAAMEGSLPFPFSVCKKQKEVAIFR
jgi:hypothetical protein